MKRAGELPGQWSHCLGACRSEAMRALCLCVPHSLPPLERKTHIQCSLEDLDCLAKHAGLYN